MQYEKEKDMAVKLRKEGLSYSEILKKISVAKSTLSLWLRSVNLSKKQNQRLTEKKILAQKRGAEARKNIRILQTKNIFNETKNDVTKIIHNPLWFAGILLYWAEGSKQKDTNVAQRVSFANSDEKMIRLFVKWLNDVLKIKKDDLTFELYIHEKSDFENAKEWWAHSLSCEKEKIRIYFKRHQSKNTKRKNTEENYHGLMRVTVKTSTRLNRKISAWIIHLCKYCGIV